MPEIYSRLDYKKLILNVLEEFAKPRFPEIDINKLEVKLLPVRKTGLHSLLNFMVLSKDMPLLVIRMPRYQDGKLAFKALKNEAEILRDLKLKCPLNGHLPQMYQFLEIDNIPVVLLKGYNGQMLHKLLDEEEDLTKLNELITSGAELILKYSKIENKEKIIDDAFLQKYIYEPLKLIIEYYPQYITRIEKLLSELINPEKFLNLKYPSVLLHQEFNPWNILREENGNLVILDWEDAVIEGLPFLDLFNYYTICYRILFKGESEHSKNRKIEDKKKRASLLLNNFNKFIEIYCGALNISPELKDFFFIIFAINSTCFFLADKRKEIEYSKTWFSLLINSASADCFENYIKKEVLFYESAGK